MDNNNYCNQVPLSMLSPHSITNCVDNNCEIDHLIIILHQYWAGKVRKEIKSLKFLLCRKDNGLMMWWGWC